MGSLVAKCRKDRQKPGEGIGLAIPKRRLRANDRAYNDSFQYATNFIKTSKYNLISFVPKNLFEQFNRLANFYFLMLMILQWIPWVSSLSPVTTMVPLIFVLAVTMVKDGYDDHLFPTISPYPAWSTALPLFVVLLFSAIKDATDDIQRHRSDNQVNNRRTLMVRDGELIEERWLNIKVGDIIKLEDDNFVAADLLLLSSSEPHGLCYVETAELDGETNLKARQALSETFEALGDNVQQFSNFDGEIVCEAPNNRLSVFEGALSWNDQTYPLDNDQMLLRGCVLRNTKWCFGLVVFAGRDTKLMMNSGKSAFKRTSLDRFLNVLIIGIVIFLLAMCLICMVLSGVWEWTTGQNFTAYLPWENIVPEDDKPAAISLIALLMFASYAILLNTVVPISLYVSVEVIRLWQSWWINWDLEMYYEKTDTPAHSRTTTLNEELGQVQYIFSDKTGTLTQNIMTFNKCTIDGRVYGTFEESIPRDMQRIDFSSNPYHEPTFVFYDRHLMEDTKRLGSVQLFWRCLALCHTVMADKRNGQLAYQAQSPDESALTAAARNFGFVFLTRTPRSITIEVQGNTEQYELLHILDFNNVRKRMSVIVRDPATGVITLFCKGADTMVMERLSADSTERLRDITLDHLDKFASEGLRTLCLAYKTLDHNVYREWAQRQKEAAVALDDRQGQLDACYEEIEQEMTLIGASAIEDKLQDGVPETIANLAAANIKIWVLTGDKQETAINIGYSCRLLTESMVQVFVIDGDESKDVETQLKHTKQQLDHFDERRNRRFQIAEETEHGGPVMNSPMEGPGVPTVRIQNGAEQERTDSTMAPERPLTIEVPGDSSAENVNTMDDEGEGFGLVVNGHSLVYALQSNLEHLFLEVACRTNAVICCRVTPLQKAMVVDLVKRNKNSVTLAIGDGANDVSMIKTAHIGVGISGQEGMQAVLSSDFSLAQFRYLERLLLVHGRWSYLRMSKFLRYFFYKNFAFTLSHFWYSFFCGYSAMNSGSITCWLLLFRLDQQKTMAFQTIYDPTFIALYNLIFTSQPVLALGIFDQDVDDNYSLKFPKLYIPGQYNLFFNMRIFIYSVLHGIVSSLVFFFVPYGTFYMSSNVDGLDTNDYPNLAFTIFSCLVVVVSAQIAIETSYWTFWNHFTIWGSLIVYLLFIIVYYQVLPYIGWIMNTNSASHGVTFQAMSGLPFWLCLLLTSVMLLMPVVGVRYFWQDTHPDLSDRLRIRQNLPRLARRGLGELPLRTIKRHATARRSRRGSLRSGYAFSHQQGFGELITMGKFWRQLELRAAAMGSSAQLSPGRPLSPVHEGLPPGLKVGMSPLLALTGGLPGPASESSKQHSKGSKSKLAEKPKRSVEKRPTELPPIESRERDRSSVTEQAPSRTSSEVFLTARSVPPAENVGVVRNILVNTEDETSTDENVTFSKL